MPDSGRKPDNDIENEELVKVRVAIPDDSGWELESEGLWAKNISPGVFELRNIPFYAYGLSCEDHVTAEPDEHGQMYVKVVLERGGHSTYRVFSRTGFEVAPIKKIIEELEFLGCEFEFANPKHLAVDVPPRVDVYAVYEVLEKGETAGLFEFEEGLCGHPLREQSRVEEE